MFIWIAALASNIWVALAGFFTRKTVVATGSIGAGVSLMLSLSVALNFLLAGLVRHMPDWAQQGVMMFVPENGPFCLSAIITALGYRWAYNFAQRSIDRVVQA